MRSHTRRLFTSANNRRPLTKIRARVLELLGSLLIKAGGRFGVLDDDGNLLVYIGATYNTDTGNRSGSGLIVERPNEVSLLEVISRVNDVGELQVFDDGANAVISTDAGGLHLARPYLQYPLPVAVDAGSWPSTTTTGSWVTLARSYALKQHPKVRCYADVAAVGASGQARLVVNGQQIGDTAYAPGQLDVSGAVPSDYLDVLEFELQVYNDTGAGELYGQVLMLYGLGETPGSSPINERSQL